MGDDRKSEPDLAVAKAAREAAPSASSPEIEEQLEAKIERVVEDRVFQIIASFHQGPLPTPQDLAAYEGALKGTANRIVRMAEIEQENRHAADRRDADRQTGNEREAVRIYGRNTLIGLISATVIAIGTIGGGIWLIYLGKETAGLAAIVVALGGLVGAFVAGRLIAGKRGPPDPTSGGTPRKARPTLPHTRADVGASGAIRRT